MVANLASHKEQRVAVFIDTQNLYHSAKSIYRANVNYEELISVAVGDRKLIRAFAYVIKSEDNTEEKFFDALEDFGIENRVKDLQVFHTGAKKADWDVGIAVDMIRLTEKVDVIVLVSGDGDFVEVVRYCQSRGVRVEVLAFDKTTNAQLMEEADFFLDLGDRNHSFLIGKRRSYTKKRGVSSGSVAQSSRAESVSVSNKPALLNTNKAVEAPTLAAKTVNKSYTGSYYGSSNISGKQSQSGSTLSAVNPNIYSNKKKIAGRNIKPVIGLPGKPSSPVLSNNNYSKLEKSANDNISNAFGNAPPSG